MTTTAMEPAPDDTAARSAVLGAVRRRARALAEADVDTLYEMLHPHFRWTSHRGNTVGRETYIWNNTDGTLVWRAQDLDDITVTVVGNAAVVTCVVTDHVTRAGQDERYTMPMTQTWVRDGDKWVCLAGHAGPSR